MKLIDADALEARLGNSDEDINFREMLREAPNLTNESLLHSWRTIRGLLHTYAKMENLSMDQRGMACMMLIHMETEEDTWVSGDVRENYEADDEKPRLLTPVEVLYSVDKDLFFEEPELEGFREYWYLEAVNPEPSDHNSLHAYFDNGGERSMDEYGITWRCWSSEPTPRQMGETPWEGDDDD